MSSIVRSGIRGWRPGGLLAFLAAVWILSVLCISIATSNRLEGALALALLLVLPFVPSVVAIIWAWNRPEIGKLHFGKLLILWGGFAFSAYLAGEVDGDFLVLALFAGGPPLLVFTWSWLSGRERS